MLVPSRVPPVQLGKSFCFTSLFCRQKIPELLPSHKVGCAYLNQAPQLLWDNCGSYFVVGTKLLLFMTNWYGSFTCQGFAYIIFNIRICTIVSLHNIYIYIILSFLCIYIYIYMYNNILFNVYIVIPVFLSFFCRFLLFRVWHKKSTRVVQPLNDFLQGAIHRWSH